MLIKRHILFFKRLLLGVLGFVLGFSNPVQGMGFTNSENIDDWGGAYHFVKNLPQQTQQAYKNSKAIRGLLLSRYRAWKTATQNLDNLSPFEKRMLTQQQTVWKTLGLVEEVIAKVIKSADELLNFVITNGIRADIDLDYVIKFTKGRRDLCESILLSTKDVVEGKNVEQLIQHFSIPNQPTANSLTNYQSRIWYHHKKSSIPKILDKTKSIEEQAKQAFDFRNQFRVQARGFMSDRNLADFLISNEPNLTWFGYVNYLQTQKGLSGSRVWNYIINSASTGRDDVDALFKLN